MRVDTLTQLLTEFYFVIMHLIWVTILSELLVAILCFVAFRTDHEHPHTSEEQHNWMLSLHGNLSGSFLLLDAFGLLITNIEGTRVVYIRKILLFLPGMSSGLIFFSVSLLSVNLFSNYLIQALTVGVVLLRLYLTLSGRDSSAA